MPRSVLNFTQRFVTFRNLMKTNNGNIFFVPSLPIFSIQQLFPPQISLLESNASVGIVLSFKAKI